MSKLFLTPWMNKKAADLILECKRTQIFNNYDIIETLQTLECWAIKYRGKYSFRKDYVGPEGFFTKIIPKLWWNRGAWLHDGWFEYISEVGELGIFKFEKANEFFDICNKVNSPKEYRNNWLNKIAYFAVSTFGRFAIKKRS